MNNRKAWDLVPCGLYAVSSENRITAWNAAMSRLTGLPADQMIGQDASQVQFQEPLSEQDVVNPLQCVISGSSDSLSRAVYIRDADEKLRLCFLQARPVDDPACRDCVLLVAVSDISEEISCDLYETSLQEHRPDNFHGIVGHSPKIQEVIRLIQLAADSTVNVLITGESGTGKELVARAIHQISDRRNHPFVTVNCSALPESLLESELFGHVRGAFTGAYRDKIGKFEAAGGGTIFLDEIGDISPAIQVKLLRVIQEKEIERVGDNRKIKVDMRVVTATNRDLRGLVESGAFRDDLYYRLKVFPIHATALRERLNDIPLLTRHFVELFNRKTGKAIRGFTDNAMKLLMSYCWPGNVRELENCVEYAFVLCSDELIDVFDLPQDIRTAPLREAACAAVERRTQRDAGGKHGGKHGGSGAGPATPAPLADAAATAGTARAAGPPGSGGRTRSPISREELLELLEANSWNKTRTARQLSISRVALWKKLKAMEIEG